MIAAQDAPPRLGEIECSYSTIVGPCPAMRTSEMGQTQKSECATGKSALPPTTGIVSQTCQVRKVPWADSCSARTCPRAGPAAHPCLEAETLATPDQQISLTDPEA